MQSIRIYQYLLFHFKILTLLNIRYSGQKEIYSDEQYYCQPVQFDYDYDNINYTQQIIRITQNGMNKFIAENCDIASCVIQYTTIPDMSFNISQILFQFTNLHITSAQIPAPTIVFYYDTDQMYIDFVGAAVTIDYEFNLQQEIYPYIKEQGTGQIAVGYVGATAFIQLKPSDSCSGRLSFDMQNFQLQVQNLSINLNSSNAWLYQGVLELLTQVVTDAFNTQLQPYFKDLIQNAVNQNLQEMDNLYSPVGNTIKIDQQYTGLDIKSQYMDLQLVGTFCQYQKDNNSDQEYCTGHVMEPEQNYQLIINKPTNDDMQLYFGQEVLKSMFQYFMQNDSIQKILKQCVDPLIVNTGIISTCIDQNNTPLDFHFSTNLQYLDDSSTHLLLYLSLDNYQEYQYKQQIDDALYQLSTGTSLGYRFSIDDCWPMYSGSQYVSMHCNI